jgi:hypothetical protein
MFFRENVSRTGYGLDLNGKIKSPTLVFGENEVRQCNNFGGNFSTSQIARKNEKNAMRKDFLL